MQFRELLFLISTVLCANAHADDIKIRCEKETKLDCRACFDGCGTICWYDKTGVGPRPVGPGDAKYCWAWRNWSECQPCSNEFKLNRNGELTDVTCEEFYRAVDMRKKSCGTCLEEIAGHGG